MMSSPYLERALKALRVIFDGENLSNQPNLLIDTTEELHGELLQFIQESTFRGKHLEQRPLVVATFPISKTRKTWINSLLTKVQSLGFACNETLLLLVESNFDFAKFIGEASGSGDFQSSILRDLRFIEIGTNVVYNSPVKGFLNESVVQFALDVAREGLIIEKNPVSNQQLSNHCCSMVFAKKLFAIKCPDVNDITLLEEFHARIPFDLATVVGTLSSVHFPSSPLILCVKDRIEAISLASRQKTSHSSSDSGEINITCSHIEYGQSLQTFISKLSINELSFVLNSTASVSNMATCIERGAVEVTENQVYEIIKSFTNELLFSEVIPLFELGLDSEELHELRLQLQTHFQTEITTAVFFQYPTPKALYHALTNTAAKTHHVFDATFFNTCKTPAVQLTAFVAGVGCKFANDVDDLHSFSAMLVSGLDSVRSTPVNRYLNSSLAHNDLLGSGSYLSSIDVFDATFFNINQREATFLDPQQRHLLETSWHALEDANLEVKDLFLANGAIYSGMFSADYASLLLKSYGSHDTDMYFGTGNCAAVAAGRLAYFYGTQGPCMSVETACSSSMVAMHLAVECLRSRTSSTALVTGASLLLSPELSVNFRKTNMLSPDGRCKTFDVMANGYVRSEAVISMIVQDETNLVKSTRNYAIVKACAINHDGASNGLTAPNGLAQESVYRDALRSAGVEPVDIQYLEAHGTGTALGDLVESKSIQAVYQTANTVFIGSVKSNLGHTEASAGLASVLKILGILQSHVMPVNLHMSKSTVPSNTNFDVLVSGQRFSGECDFLSGISSFGMSGTNAHCILEKSQYSTSIIHNTTALAVFPYPISGKDASSLANRLDSMKLAIEQISGPFVVPAASTNFAKRSVVMKQESKVLSVVESNSYHHSSDNAALLFTGQASQYPNMSKELYSFSDIYKSSFDSCVAHFQTVDANQSLMQILFPVANTPRSREVAAETQHSQPLLFALEYSLACLWMNWGVEPSLLCGYSLGEYVAAATAQVASVADICRIVGVRGKLMQSASTGSMLAVSATVSVVDKFLQLIIRDGSKLTVSGLNSHTQTVLSGLASDIVDADLIISALGHSASHLHVSHAFHSALMQPIMKDYSQFLSKIQFSKCSIPIVSNIDGRIISEVSAEYWCEQLLNAVDFHSCVNTMQGAKISTFLEIGPHPTLLAFAKSIVETPARFTWLASLRRGSSDIKELFTAASNYYVNNGNVNWQAIYSSFGSTSELCGEISAMMKYRFNRTSYWFAGAMPSVSDRTTGIQSQASTIHPLLGNLLQVPETKGTFYSNVLSLQRYEYLKDHFVFNAVIFPASGYLELFLSCASLQFQTSYTHLKIVDLLTESKLEIGSAGIFIQTFGVSANSGRTLNMEVFGKHTDASAWKKYASAQCETLLQEQDDHEDTDVREHLSNSASDLHADILYDGLTYKQHFKTLSQCQKYHDGLLCHLEYSLSDTKDYLLHPRIGDGILQSQILSHIIDDLSNKPLIPFLLKSVILSTSLWGCHELIVHSISKAVGQILLGSSKLYNASGVLVGEMADCNYFRFIADVDVAITDARAQLSYQTIWEDIDLLRDTTHRGGTCLLVGHPDTVFSSVCRILDSLNYSIFTVHPSTDIEKITENEMCIGRGSHKHYQNAYESAMLFFNREINTVLNFVPKLSHQSADLFSSQLMTLINCLQLTKLVSTSPNRCRFITVTFHSTKILDTDDTLSTMVSGFVKTAGLEYANLIIQHVDVIYGKDAAKVISDFVSSNCHDETTVAVRSSRYFAERCVDNNRCKYRLPVELSLDTSANDCIISGGLGSLGKLCMSSMIKSGHSSNFLIISRTAHQGEAESLIDGHRSSGIRIQTVIGNVSDKTVLFQISKHRNLLANQSQSIVHTAGVLNDATLSNMTVSAVMTTAKPKLQGCLHFHWVSKSHFVSQFILYSSITAVIGNAGQSNYAAANSFLNEFASTRVKSGLTAKSLSWGNWADVGMAVQAENSLLRRGFVPLPLDEGLRCLHAAIQAPQHHFVFASLDWQKIVTLQPRLANWSHHVFRPQRKEKATVHKQIFADKQRRTKFGSQKNIREMVEDTVRSILGTNSKLNSDLGFFQLGLDSLASIDLRNNLQAQIGDEFTLSSTVVFDYPNIGSLAKYIEEHMTEQTPDSLQQQEVPKFRPSLQRDAGEGTAILSAQCRFPNGADSVDKYWDLLNRGMDGMQQIPSSRWPNSLYYSSDANARNNIYTQHAGFMTHGIEKFDAQFFSISPMEAINMDPQQRILLEVCWEMIENAGTIPNSFMSADVGVFVGTVYAEYEEILMQTQTNNAYFITGNYVSMLAGRLAYTFGLQGPTLTIDTACSSSLVAMSLARMAFIQQRLPFAFAGGASLILSPQGMIDRCKAKMLSPEGHCKSFDRNADGYARGEGCAMFLLQNTASAGVTKPYLGIVDSCLVNQDGASSGLMAPNGVAQQKLIKATVSDSSINSIADVRFIETHGTGTSLGDPIEVNAIWEAYCRTVARDERLILTTAKTSVGHCEGSAGIAGALKTVLAFQHNRVTRHRNFAVKNPRISLDALPSLLALEAVQLNEQSGDYTAISSFGASGTNSHALLLRYKAPAIDETEIPENSHMILPFSSKNIDGLSTMSSAWAEYLSLPAQQSYANIAYSASVHRQHFRHCAGVIGNTKQSASDALKQGNFQSSRDTVYPQGSQTTAFLFSGQASEYINMGRELFQYEPVFRASFKDCCETVKKQNNVLDIERLLFVDDEERLLGADSNLHRTDVCQPLLFCFEYALAMLWQSIGVKPSVAVGHSLGEIVAFAVSGILTLDDALKLVVYRGNAMQQTVGRHGAMLVLNRNQQFVQNFLHTIDAPSLQPAAYNSETQSVISGRMTETLHMRHICDQLGIETGLVNDIYAFHCDLMKEAGSMLLSYVQKMSFNTGSFPVACNVHGSLITEVNPAYFYAHSTCPVQFQSGLKSAHTLGANIMLEVGPHPVLSNLVQMTELISDCLSVYSISRKEHESLSLCKNITKLFVVTGVDIDWVSKYSQTQLRFVSIPLYTFQKEIYWPKARTVTLEMPPVDRTKLGLTPTSFHPLLGHQISAIDDENFAMKSDLLPDIHSLAYILRHKLFQQALVPAGALLEAFIAFACLNKPSTTVINVENFEIVQPLLFRQQVIKTSLINSHLCQIFAKGVDEENQLWTKIAAANLASTSEMDLSHVECSSEEYISCTAADIERIYGHVRRLGLDYGNLFQTVQEAQLNGLNGTVKIALREFADEIYKVHPCLLDGVLQATHFAFWAQYPETLHLPTSIQRFSMKLIGLSTVIVHAMANSSADTLCCEATIYDDVGNALGEIFGLKSKYITKRSFLRLVSFDSPAKHFVYATTWEEVDLSPIQSFHKGASIVCLTADTRTTAQGTRSHLRVSLSQGAATKFDSEHQCVDINDYTQVLQMFDKLSSQDTIEHVALFVDGFCNHRVDSILPTSLKLAQVMLSTVKVCYALQTHPYLWFIDNIVPKNDMLASSTVSGFIKTVRLEIELDITQLFATRQAEALAFINSYDIQAKRSRILLQQNTCFVEVLRKERDTKMLGSTRLAQSDLSVTEFFVSGGLGALGWESASWLTEKGCRKLVLFGRKAPDETIQMQISQARAAGTEIRIASLDIANQTDIYNLMAASMAGHKAFLHSAGVLRGSSIMEIQLAQFQQVYEVKILGALNMHYVLSSYAVHHYILYSSISSVLGNESQSNYAAANSYLDHFAQHRTRIGHMAQSISWGNWSGIGMAAKLAKFHASLGYTPLSPQQGIKGLDYCIESEQTHLLCTATDWKIILSNHPQLEFWLHHIVKVDDAKDIHSVTHTDFLTILPKPVKAVVKPKIDVRTCVIDNLAAVLGLQSVQEVNNSEGFMAMGMDSLMAVDFLNRIQEDLGDAVKLGRTVVFDYPTVAKLTEFIDKYISADIGEPDKLEHLLSPLETGHIQEKFLLIHGAACYFPGGSETTTQYWDNLCSGRDLISTVPSNRWDIDKYYDADMEKPGKMYTKRGGFLNRSVQNFDCAFFGISPREAICMDPQQRLLLQTVWQALENAMILPEQLIESNSGVFVGIGAPDYQTIVGMVSEAEISAYHATGNSNSIAAGRIAYSFALQGPTMSIDTACSSSMVALHTAFEMLKTGNCDKYAVVNGVNMLLLPMLMIVLSKIKALSPDGTCKTFDADANGYVRSEGISSMIISYDSRTRSRHPIIGSVASTAINQDGASGGLTVPNGVAQISLLNKALSAARLDPTRVNYLEAHGTGTPLGDPIEINAINNVYLQTLDGRSESMLFGAAKSCIGHLESVSGLAGLFKLLQMQENSYASQNLHFRQMNKFIEFSTAAAIPVTGCTSLPGADTFSGISSFGFSGTNAHSIVTNACNQQNHGVATTTVTSLLVPLSGKNKRAVNSKEDSVKSLLSSIQIDDIITIESIHRSHQSQRSAILMAAQTGKVNEILSSKEHSAYDVDKVCFLYTGLGSERTNMGRQLYEASEYFRSTIDQCKSTLGVLHDDLSLTDILFPKSNSMTTTINQTCYSQPSLCSFELAVVNLLNDLGIVQSHVIGHSVGEYAAAAAAGIMSPEAACKLTKLRGKLVYDLHLKGSMSALSCSMQTVAPVVQCCQQLFGSDQVYIAANNSASQSVISGSSATVAWAEDIMVDMGYSARRIAIPTPLHSPLLKTIVDQFVSFASTFHYSVPSMCMISSVTGKRLHSANANYWGQHLLDRVSFSEGISTMLDENIGVFLEVGPQPTLSTFGRSTLHKPMESANALWLKAMQRGTGEWATLLSTIGQMYVNGAKITWEKLYSIYEVKANHKKYPNYPFQEEYLWLEAKPSSSQPMPKQIEEEGFMVETSHPLLGKLLPLSCKDEHVFFAKLSLGNAEHQFLQDNVVFDSVVFPGSAYVELVLAYGAYLGNSTFCVKSFLIQKPLVLDREVDTLLETVGKEQNSKTTEISISSSSFKSDKTRNWTLNARGIYDESSNIGARPAETISVTEFQSQSDSIDPSAVYQVLANTGIAYGAAFQTIKGLWRKEDVVLSQLSLVDSLSSAEYIAHPAILDGAFQSLGVCLGTSEESADVFVPFLITQLDLLQPLKHSILSLNSCILQGNQITCQLAFYSGGGLFVGKVTDLKLQKLARETIMNSLSMEQAKQSHLYELLWQEDSLQHSSPNLLSMPQTIITSSVKLRKLPGKSLYIQELLKNEIELVHLMTRARSCMYIIENITSVPMMISELKHITQFLQIMIKYTNTTPVSLLLYGSNSFFPLLSALTKSLQLEEQRLPISCHAVTDTSMVSHSELAKHNEETVQFSCRCRIYHERLHNFRSKKVNSAVLGTAFFVDIKHLQIVPQQQIGIKLNEVEVQIQYLSISETVSSGLVTASAAPDFEIGDSVVGEYARIGVCSSHNTIASNSMAHFQGQLICVKQLIATIQWARSQTDKSSPTNFNILQESVKHVLEGSANFRTDSLVLTDIEVSHTNSLATSENQLIQIPKPCLIFQSYTHLLSTHLQDSGTCIISGGRGGLGLKVAEFIVNASKLTAQVYLLERHTAKIAGHTWNYVTKYADVANRCQLRKLVDDISLSHPLTTIIHSAAVLDDCRFATMQWNSFELVAKPKILGGWNLHKTSQTAPIKHFLSFSSTASAMGSPGQSNYAIANAFLDSLTHYRLELGYPAQTINWGPSTDVGLSSNLFNQSTNQPLTPFKPREGIEILREVMELRTPQIVAVNCEWNEVARQVPQLHNWLSHVVTTEQLEPQITKLAHEESIEQRLQQQTTDTDLQKIDVHGMVTSQLRLVLGIKTSAAIDENEGFMAMGMNSLMTVDFQNKLQESFGNAVLISSTIIFDYPNVTSMVKHLQSYITVEDNLIPSAGVYSP